jgi:protocatechuate 3,4-dioxygenase beta subunit
VPSFIDTNTEVNLNKINTNVNNTFIIYKHRTIIDKYVNLEPTTENFKKVSETLEKTRGDYFNLAEPKHD